MDLMTVLLSGALLALFTAIQTWVNKARFDRVEAELIALRSDLLQVVLSATGRRDN